MRHSDAYPPDEEIVVALEVIDATLAGEPVEPEHAELAELALLLADQRPRPEPAFAAALDQRARERFASPARKRPRRRLIFAPAALVVLLCTFAAVVVLSSGGSQPPVLRTLSEPSSASPTPAAAGSATAAGPAATSAGGSARSSAGSSAGPSTASTPSPTPTPTPNGQRLVSSAQVSLSTTPGRIEQVAQQVFDVVGAAGGDVSRSTVTAAGGTGGFADFELSVPSVTLAQTMAQLSRLRGASVLSRTDATQNVTGSFVSANRRLVDARALRTALLRQLANAVTTAQVDSLRAQIRDAEASISSDLATLESLRRQVSFSQISITISTSPAPRPVTGGGFTLGKAAHDAGRVLTVAAGVALIASAVLLPIALLVAVLWFVWLVSRRRRREQALDLA
ncbi:MAG TPA: DUF4349 domain-containing protein [Solirubrobacteraceae bacterium]